MHSHRQILYLQDPLNHFGKTGYEHAQGLVFHENEPLLSQAQAALWRARRKGGWVCVAARGSACEIALALASQLPVDRLALLSPLQDGRGLPRELRRLRAFARRNLALIIAEIAVFGGDEALMRGFLRGNRHSSLCALCHDGPEQLALPWEQLIENNLLIRGKCV